MAANPVSTASMEFDGRNVTPALALEAGNRLPQAAHTAWFRIGDTFLEIISDYEPLLRELEAVYGDCGTSEPPSGSHRIRCIATRLPDLPLVSLLFDGPRADPLEAARTLTKFVRNQRYRYQESPSQVPSWRVLVNVEAGSRLLLASNGRIALVNLDETPPEFLVDYIIGVVQSAQTGVLFLHAASVGVAGAGGLLFGPSRGGKSTTSLAVALRGHSFLGDDVAAVRLATRELLPFPRSAGLRDGPLARSLDGRIQATRHVVAPDRRGVLRTLVRVSDLFPSSFSGPLPLRFAFVLDGFADQATILPFQPGLGELKRLKLLVMDPWLSWGLSPGRDLMNFLSILNLLSSLHCYLVTLGSPEETARLIEAEMEGTCTST